MSSENSIGQASRADQKWKKLSLFAIPVLVFGVIAIVFAIGLTLDPKKIPSVMIGKSIPAFKLPPVAGRELGLSDKNFDGKISLVNVFASWCAECRAEHPLLMDLSAKGVVDIYGLNYKDKPVDAQNWLDNLGDPYSRTGADRNGRVSIDWGVYGVPETFLVDQKKQIVFKHIGALTPTILNDQLLPLIASLRDE